ncbi:MAG: 4Fe-4S dicluster domain-containing protein [Synergistaceae bacterium]|jgi:heterodisulfide reductase subunit C|nr:4Fe-4S dicluster domain-containing protein [Synergistaceae bacterium]
MAEANGVKKLVSNFKDEVASRPGGENVLNCFLCGSCTACCPISEIADNYNPRLVMRRILAGMKDDVLGGGEIWRCYQCHSCVAHCPQDVRFADIVRALRGMSVEQGYRDAKLAEDVDRAGEESRRELLERVNALIASAAG